MREDVLASWRDNPSMRAIVEFVEQVTTDGLPTFVPAEQRIAVFDNDGTLWCEKPIPIELGFVLQRLSIMAADDPALQERQPWKAAYDRDYAWLSNAITRHHAGDDSDERTLLGGILKAFDGMTVDTYTCGADAFLHGAQHPTLGRTFCACFYQPMVELLRYLHVHGFTTFIASAGDRDFMRSVAQEIYGIPPERVIGSSTALRYQENEYGGSVVYAAQPDVFDDGPAKPVRIWSRVGRRPILAVGNSDGDVPMLEFTERPSAPGLRVVILHDDTRREFAYTAGAEQLLDRAHADDWTIVSMRDDWKAVFAA